MKYTLKINDMSYERQDAIDRCYNLGDQFTKHFEKIYFEPNSKAVNHWCNEMQGWLDEARKIRLKQNNKLLSYTYLMDWFLTKGSSPETFFKEEVADKYEEFLIKLPAHNFDVKETIKDIFNLN